MTNHDIIVAKVFKAKYFLSVDFLDAQLGHNPSFVWRSIHASWVVVKEGLQWRISNDNSIHAWIQPWLKNGNNIYASSNHFNEDFDLKVGDLVDHNSCTWNKRPCAEHF